MTRRIFSTSPWPKRWYIVVVTLLAFVLGAGLRWLVQGGASFVVMGIVLAVFAVAAMQIFRYNWAPKFDPRPFRGDSVILLLVFFSGAFGNFCILYLL